MTLQRWWPPLALLLLLALVYGPTVLTGGLLATGDALGYYLPTRQSPPRARSSTASGPGGTRLIFGHPAAGRLPGRRAVLWQPAVLDLATRARHEPGRALGLSLRRARDLCLRPRHRPAARGCLLAGCAPSVLPGQPGPMARRVKIELGARSETEPGGASQPSAPSCRGCGGGPRPLRFRREDHRRPAHLLGEGDAAA